VQLEPDNAEMRNSMGIVLFRQGKLSEAVWHWQEALRFQPGNASAHNNLGEALLQQNRVAEAIDHYQQAVQLSPGNTEACNKLAWVLATCADAKLRNGARAVELAKQANQLAGGKDVDILDTLAAAYAEAGSYAEAVQTAQAALELAKATGPAEKARKLQERLQLYQAGRPYREKAPSAP